MLPVGPANSTDEGRPRPLISLETVFDDGMADIRVCPEIIVNRLTYDLDKSFTDETNSVSNKISTDKTNYGNYIFKKYGVWGIPMIRISLSKSLFINERDFSYDYLKIDNLRIDLIKEKLWSGIESCFNKL